MDPLVLLIAALSGLAVALATHVAGRLGGTLGGLLATAPITSTAAILYLSAGTADAGVLHGAKSLFAALLAIPAYALILRRSGRPVAALAAFLAIFTLGGLLLAQITPAGAEGIWVAATLALAALLGVQAVGSGPRDPTPAATSLRELAFRFAAGAAVILIVDALRGVAPVLAAAWAFFPGTFLVTVMVVSWERGRETGAQTAQGGVLGIPPLLAYLLTVWALQPLGSSMAWAWFVQVPAWIAYFSCMVGIWRSRVRPVAAGAPA